MLGVLIPRSSNRRPGRRSLQSFGSFIFRPSTWARKRIQADWNTMPRRVCSVVKNRASDCRSLASRSFSKATTSRQARPGPPGPLRLSLRGATLLRRCRRWEFGDMWKCCINMVGHECGQDQLLCLQSDLEGH